MNGQYYCYLLVSEETGYTYVGITNNLRRRIRQHNGEISGGAKRTRANRPWRIHCFVGPFQTKGSSLSFEARVKYYRPRRLKLPGKLSIFQELIASWNNTSEDLIHLRLHNNDDSNSVQN
jgi:predicted GIY-YIG superfamily endonuclease